MFLIIKNCKIFVVMKQGYEMKIWSLQKKMNILVLKALLPVWDFQLYMLGVCMFGDPLSTGIYKLAKFFII